jgi:hypothetical protein
MARRHRRNNAQRLRNAVEALPRHTQEAMIEALDRNRIIIGAYTDKRGGVCPMLGAHRFGGRTNFGTFARAWDAFTGADRRKPRRASRREVRTLRGYLEMALLGEEWRGRPLADEVREVKSSRRRLAELEAQDAQGLTLDEVLAGTYAAVEEQRVERRTRELLDPNAPQRVESERS